MMDSLEWMVGKLGYRPYKPTNSERMDRYRQMAQDVGQVVVFGAGGAGKRLFQTLTRQGIEVAFFIDNQVDGEFCGVPVYFPQSVPACKLPVLIASAWFVEIAHQLKKQDWCIDNHLLFPVPDVLQLEGDFYDSLAGWPFFQILNHRLNDFQKVYDMWEDQESKEKYIKLLNYRLGFFNPASLQPNNLPCSPSKYQAAEQKITDTNIDIKLLSSVKTLFEYQYKHPIYYQTGFMQPQTDDIVIDGGAWEGDTALWYLQHIGGKGHIYAFEPSLYSRNLMQENIKAIDRLDQVTIEPYGLSNTKGYSGWCELEYATPCSHLADEGETVQVTSIDRYVDEQNIEKIDVIKLDVEGADYKALTGAVDTIKAYKPDLAISIYHSPHHLVDIPLWIHRLGLNYRLRFCHNQLSVTESVCLATVRGL